MDKKEPSYIVRGKVNCNTHYVKQYEDFSKN